MRYNKLGRTGLLVSELCLGTMTFGEGPGIWSAIAKVKQDEADQSATRMDQLEDNIAAADIALGAEDLAKLGEVSALPSEYPGWMFERQGMARKAQLDPAPRGATS